ncbi:MAG TPA: preprotein translocase subunit SecG [Casimicrobiaceae bacterium]|jgi:preprotein translocase subunit SecG|nr:preprotein translocase subunit SecG [Casimicrobiaceae bacterium]
MNIWESVLLVLHLMVAAGICGFVLLQHGKGADMGAAFGSGSAGSVFGAAGSANFLSRTTAWLAAVFFLTSVGLTYLGTQHYRARGGGLMDQVPVTAPATKDAAPAKAGDATPPANPAPGAGGAAPSKAGEVPK